MPAPAFTYDQLQDQYATNGIGAITALCHRRFVSSAIGWRSTVDPTVNNARVDTAVLGSYFDAGQLWANTLTKTVWLCMDGAPTAAIWKNMTATDINWLGAWNALFSYVPGDAVDSGGSSYLCILANINQVPPNATYWQLLAAGVAGGPAGGDLGGTYPNPVVDKVRGVAISATPPTAGQVLTATGSAAADWETPGPATPTGSASGDLGGTYPSPAVNKVRGVAITATPPTAGQVLTATGSAAADWETPGGGGALTFGAGVFSNAGAFTNPAGTWDDIENIASGLGAGNYLVYMNLRSKLKMTSGVGYIVYRLSKTFGGGGLFHSETLGASSDQAGEQKDVMGSTVILVSILAGESLYLQGSKQGGGTFNSASFETDSTDGYSSWCWIKAS